MRFSLAVLCWFSLFFPILARAQENTPAADTAAAQITNGAARTETHSAITFRIKPYTETWRGQPGYSANMDFLDTESVVFPQVKEIADYINGQVTEALFFTRMTALAQQGSAACSYTAISPCQYETGMSAMEFQNIGAVASVRYISSDFSIGAAHPNFNVLTYNFSLRPMFRIVSLSEMFIEPDKVFPKLQAHIRASLMSSAEDNNGQALDKNTVWQGTADWGAFSAFTPAKDGVEVYFAPYSVAAFAFGIQKAFVPYVAIKDDLKPFYRKALKLDE